LSEHTIPCNWTRPGPSTMPSKLAARNRAEGSLTRLCLLCCTKEFDDRFVCRPAQRVTDSRCLSLRRRCGKFVMQTFTRDNEERAEEDIFHVQRRQDLSIHPPTARIAGPGPPR
jgi:hypothetical protein